MKSKEYTKIEMAKLQLLRNSKEIMEMKIAKISSTPYWDLMELLTEALLGSLSKATIV